jgi:hypothetical protein
LSFLRLTKGEKKITKPDRVFAELAHERFRRPGPTAFSGPLDGLRQAFVDRIVDVNMHAANKAAAGAAFAKVTPDKPQSLDSKARKATAEKRMVVAPATTVARVNPSSKPKDTTRTPSKK